MIPRNSAIGWLKDARHGDYRIVRTVKDASNGSKWRLERVDPGPSRSASPDDDEPEIDLSCS